MKIETTQLEQIAKIVTIRFDSEEPTNTITINIPHFESKPKIDFILDIECFGVSGGNTQKMVYDMLVVTTFEPARLTGYVTCTYPAILKTQ
jgi:hypothetical protein